MPIKLKTVAIRDENTLKDLIEWAKALRGGALGVAQKVCSELVVAAIKMAINGVHTYQVQNQIDGMLRWKKEGNEWKAFARTGRCRVAVIYSFADRQGKTTQIPYPAIARAVNGFVEVAVINPRTGMTIKTVKTSTRACQLRAGDWAVEYWPEYKRR